MWLSTWWRQLLPSVCCVHTHLNSTLFSFDRPCARDSLLCFFQALCVMLATVQPVSTNLYESLSTLQFASRARHVINTTTQNAVVAKVDSAATKSANDPSSRLAEGKPVIEGRAATSRQRGSSLPLPPRRGNSMGRMSKRSSSRRGLPRKGAPPTWRSLEWYSVTIRMVEAECGRTGLGRKWPMLAIAIALVVVIIL